jgi:predicted RND superfamily exporter protein
MTILAFWQIPNVKFDSDPENMLSSNEPVRVQHNKLRKRFGLYDYVIVGIVNEVHPDGIFNVKTLKRIDTLTKQLLSLQIDHDGVISVQRPHPIVLKFQPNSLFQRIQREFFHQDPADLFKDQTSVIINREMMSLSVIDNIHQASEGSLKLEYLMETPPKNREEALRIRDDALSNPLFNGTVVSKDGRATCLYVPIVDKKYSYNVANLIKRLTKDWPAEDQLYLTGLPVAEDTFGVEMLSQVATSAPLAGFAIFVMLLIFFRQIRLIVAPMILSIVTVIVTMGILIAGGYKVHIMASMVGIFLMPIAVVSSVHILSEYHNIRSQYESKADTIRAVVDHLFMPILYTTLTTVVGFASLAATPIPPVQVFGLHIAFGVALAWLLTISFIPASIVLFSHDEPNEPHSKRETHEITLLTKTLDFLSSLVIKHSVMIIVSTIIILIVAVLGIARININDNPTKWFSPEHEIRKADRILNDHFDGTYTAYLVLSEDNHKKLSEKARHTIYSQKIEKHYKHSNPAFVKQFQRTIAEVDRENLSPNQFFPKLIERTKKLEEKYFPAWEQLIDRLYELDRPQVQDIMALVKMTPKVPKLFTRHLEKILQKEESENALNRAIAFIDQEINSLPTNLVYETKINIEAPLFKQPQMLRYIAGLQEYLLKNNVVGKSNSLSDAVKKTAYELLYQKDASKASNEKNYTIPNSSAAIGQVTIQLEGMKKKESLFHLTTRDYQQVNLWLQLRSGNNQDMLKVINAVKTYMQNNPPPTRLQVEWAGLTYINVVWQEKIVSGMLKSLGSSFIVVFIMMAILFRSALYGLLSMIPLTVTIAFIYGLIGLMGKDYDMPVAVLSSLTLGLSVDFAIHFLERFKEIYARNHNWQLTTKAMFKEPARAISRNAIVIAIGFTPLLLAPLVPYQTVGFFLATIMGVSGIVTLLLLPAILGFLHKYFLTDKIREEISHENG